MASRQQSRVKKVFIFVAVISWLCCVDSQTSPVSQNNNQISTSSPYTSTIGGTGSDHVTSNTTPPFILGPFTDDPHVTSNTTPPFFLEPFTDDPHGFYDFYGGHDTVNPADIDVYLERPDTIEYLESFSNVYQRHIIKETLRYCPYIRLCNFTFGLTPPPPGIFRESPCCEFCLCEPECEETASCCPDYRGLQLQSVTRSTTTGPAESCMLTQIRSYKDTVSYMDNLVLAVQTCPPDTDEQLSFRCSGEFQNFKDISFDDVTPLSDNVTMKTYRNKHCAKCNGADVNALILWKMTLYCPFNPDFTTAANLLSSIIRGESQCNIQLGEPLHIRAEYCSHVKSTCNQTGLWVEFDAEVERSCHAYSSTIIVEYNDENVYFDNPFCAICNGLTPTEYICKSISADPGSPFPFSGLLSFGPRDTDDVITTCGKQAMYDDITDRCREVSCSPYRTFKNGRCDVLIESLDSAGYRISGILVPSSNVSLEQMYEVMMFVLVEIEGRVISDNNAYICCKQTLMNVRNSSIDDDTLMVDSVELQFDVINSYGDSIADYVDELLKMEGLELDMSVPDSGNVTFRFHLKSEMFYHPLPYDLYINWTVPDNAPIDLEDLMLLSFELDEKTVVPYFSWNIRQGPCSSSGAIYPLLTLRPCPMYRINITEFGLIETTQGMMFESTNESALDLSDYVKTETRSSEILLCVDTYIAAFQHLKPSDDTASLTAELIVSVASVAISIVCLLITFLTYCVIPRLQTLPGKNNMALIIALLLAQSVYLVSSYAGFESGTIECKVIGGITHFLWMLSITWMNACTFHMFRVLLQTRDMAHRSSSMKYFQYHIYCIIVSLIFVTINITVSMVSSDGVDVGYGKDRCYISEQRMVEFTFGIPAGVLIIANITMFVIIIIKLKRAPNVSKNVKHERNYFFVFAKLSTITGATWLFGFLYMWTDIIAFSYIFIILNGGQGLFLMLAFVFNKRTFAMFRDRKDVLTTSIFGRTRSSRAADSNGSTRKTPHTEKSGDK